MADPQPPSNPPRLAAVNLHRQRISFLGWRPDKPDVRDVAYALDRKAGAPDVPMHWLNSEFLPPIRDQGQQGSCTGHSTRTAVQFRLAKERKRPLEEISPRFIYYNARLIEGTTNQDGGAEIRDAVKGVAKLGATTEALCPYDENVYAQRPSPSAYREAKGDLVVSYKRLDATQDASSRQPAVKQALLNGDPVVFGFTVYENFMDDETAATGNMGLPVGKVEGGHAVCIIGYNDNHQGRGWQGGVQIANSWGPDWGCKGPNGQGGYFWMPWQLVSDPNFCDDLWAIDNVN